MFDLQEHQDYEAAQRLLKEYGRNIPEPVPHFAVTWHGETAPGFVVVGGLVYALDPVEDEGGMPLQYIDNDAFFEDLRELAGIDVCRKWDIRLPWLE